MYLFTECGEISSELKRKEDLEIKYVSEYGKWDGPYGAKYFL